MARVLANRAEIGLACQRAVESMPEFIAEVERLKANPRPSRDRPPLLIGDISRVPNAAEGECNWEIANYQGRLLGEHADYWPKIMAAIEPAQD